ncbi:MAG: P-loop NTPase fold protein [Rhodospirillales bacterium]|nr:P-loop NTPase fold protein [Rhodospirillales bacterium]
MAGVRKKEEIPKRFLESPVLAGVSDSAIDKRNPKADDFDLGLRVGPIYDILRHAETETPMACAVYGTWGSGKTSAMRWLEGRLAEWNAYGDAAEGAKKFIVHSCWFYPWKYQSPEEVWRGLISVVILACLEFPMNSSKRLLREAKDLSRFVGKGLTSVLAGVTFPMGSGFKFSLKGIKDLPGQAHDYIHPEAAYLNEFEAAFRKWVEDSLGEDERLVIFIDDLDRCMPRIALQVLEALKLYLDIPNLIFVVGVDREVVDGLVIDHYDKMGIDKEKAKDYLAKMFQVYVTLAPTEPQMEGFLESIVENNAAWREIEDETARNVFQKVIGNLAGRSPRELKRLFNSALMHGAGTRLSSLGEEKSKKPPTMEQGMQAFLVHWILDNRHTRGTLFGLKVGTAFFMAWSEIVRGNPYKEPFLKIPKSDMEAIRDKRAVIEGVSEDRQSLSDGTTYARRGISDSEASEGKSAGKRVVDIPERFRPMVGNSSFRPYLELLADRELGELMRIEYPEEAATLATAETGRPEDRAIIDEAIAFELSKKAEDRAIIDEAIARELSKKVEDLTEDDRKAVTILDLSGTVVADAGPLAGLTELKQLDLSGTVVADAGPLAGLIELKQLDLSVTGVADAGPLAGLTGLERLYLSGTVVADAGPLAGLTGLVSLDLSGTGVADAGPLAGLTGLERLYLSGTGVADAGPLAGLTGLRRLDISGTKFGKKTIKGLRKALPKTTIIFKEEE